MDRRRRVDLATTSIRFLLAANNQIGPISQDYIYPTENRIHNCKSHSRSLSGHGGPHGGLLTGSRNQLKRSEFINSFMYTCVNDSPQSGYIDCITRFGTTFRLTRIGVPLYSVLARFFVAGGVLGLRPQTNFGMWAWLVTFFTIQYMTSATCIVFLY